eukprot:2391925-Rhodomonas_salina.1
MLLLPQYCTCAMLLCRLLRAATRARGTEIAYGCSSPRIASASARSRSSLSTTIPSTRWCVKREGSKG